MNDPLEAAKATAGEGYTEQAVRFALVSIATDLRRLVDHITGTTTGEPR